MSSVCDHFYPGTREGFILVSKAPPKAATDKQRTNGANRESRRAELADFLRNRRAAVRPEDVGLPGGGRRRTPGLRREEVAQLAGVGATWYTWLEQGRDIRASISVLESLANALQLDSAERAHLIMLGRGDEAEVPAPPEETVSPTMRRLIANLGANPALVLGRRWDILAWNRAYALVIGDPLELPAEWRNHVWATFMDPARRKLFADWDRGSRMMVARFRADSARHIGDPSFEALISELRERSPKFREFWQRHEVATSGAGRKFVRHPEVGRLAFEHAVFRVEESPEQRFVLYSPLPLEDTQSKLERLLADDVAGDGVRPPAAVRAARRR
jgi:transcriptional regulator with XRE-family HTH domain